MFTAQQYLDTYQGQSLLFNTKDPSLRGQCVQGVCFFVQDNHDPVEWADAYLWKNLATQYPNIYEWIDNTAAAVPQPNDIIIWSPSLPGSGGAGHIAVCLRALPGTGTFISVDQNWGGKTIHAVTHNYQYVMGWLRLRNTLPAPAAAPAPVAPAAVPAPAAPAITTQGVEMIQDTNQAHQAYKLLRPNGDGSADEIAATAGKRSWEQFATDAQGEVNARDANLRQQQQNLVDMANTINSTNATVTNLRQTINDANTTNAQKQTALDTALNQIAKDNAQLTTLHDQLNDAQAKLANPLASASAAATDVANIAKQKAGKSGGFIVAFFRFLLSAKLPSILPKLKKH